MNIGVIRILVFIVLLLIGLAVWTGKALANNAGQHSASSLLPLKVQWTSDEKCLVSADEHAFALPDQLLALRAYLMASSSKNAISLSGDVRYECVTQIMAAAKRSGINKLGFISEPASPTPN